MKTPNSPAIGASVVENKSARIGDGELMVQCFVKACEKHTEHDRGDVPDMFSCGGKANDRKDSADCRSVQFTPDLREQRSWQRGR